ncbi:hypothetical protein JR316_0005988 [Psilocybe cubensis]|uniref:Uncharacterized protein n=2 Tax=Psilocybe cubensis TaxID=181762 RepID=A0ACB8H188_PSICU|nr:hypothetical protein JR316_0005988 [Psilocybe cubensis]KAH9481462.1 hypothetical protein JR316_0005988 [Psilocybe cubensis]
MTSYASYIPMGTIPVDGPSPYNRQFTGEIASPSGLTRGPNFFTPLTYDGYTGQGTAWVVEEQHDLYHGNPQTPSKRRSVPKTHPYHYAHDTARSPTRAKFSIPEPPPGYFPFYSEGSHLITRPRRVYAVSQATDAYSDASYSPSPPIQMRLPDPSLIPKRRSPSEESVESLSRMQRDAFTTQRGPSNCERVPQAVFRAPASSGSFRYQDIAFHKEGFPEPGIRVGEIGQPTFLLEGATECTLPNTGDSFLSIQIMWPGYEPYKFKLKAFMGEGRAKVPITHETIANRLCAELLEFKKCLKVVDPMLAHSWWISRHYGDAGIDINQLFLSHMVHRGGSHWQVELWAPRRQRHS